MSKTKNKKNYKKRSKVYKALGNGGTLLTTISGFVVYESIINWSNFKNDLENFVVVNQETIKLNLAIAMPLLIAILVFIWVFRKKNQEALKGKVALPLLFGILLLWLMYSVIEATLSAMIGAFVGSAFDEGLFTPLSNSAKLKAEDDHDIALEVRRERARRKAREEIDGTV